MRKWNPASSVLLYLPSLSMTKASRWGTMRAVFTTAMMRKMAITIGMICPVPMTARCNVFMVIMVVVGNEVEII